MEEKIIAEGLCNRIKGAYVENGHALLTNKRFIYSKHSLAKIAALGVLVNLTKGDFDFDIQISDIKSVVEAKRLFSKILVITSYTGEEWKFYFTKIEEWKIHFGNLIGNHDTFSEPKQEIHSSAADELGKFKQLLDSGAITPEEYEAQKQKILNS